MELETQTQLALNQLKRQTATVNSLHGELELKSKHIKEQQVHIQYWHKEFDILLLVTP